MYTVALGPPSRDAPPQQYYPHLGGFAPDQYPFSWDMEPAPNDPRLRQSHPSEGIPQMVPPPRMVPPPAEYPPQSTGQPSVASVGSNLAEPPSPVLDLDPSATSGADTSQNRGLRDRDNWLFSRLNQSEVGANSKRDQTAMGMASLEAATVGGKQSKASSEQPEERERREEKTKKPKILAPPVERERERESAPKGTDNEAKETKRRERELREREQKSKREALSK